MEYLGHNYTELFCCFLGFSLTECPALSFSKSGNRVVRDARDLSRRLNPLAACG